jgi:gamma-glutamylcyclotransferase (GGCT)/AIG2-like uncharacterized protein YtfP
VSDHEPGRGDQLELLIVYGTLRSGTGWRERLGVDHLVRSAGPCSITGSLYDLGWYPGLVLEPTGRPVACEVLELLDPSALAVFDRFEGFDPATPDAGEYRRVTIDDPVRAWIYVFERPVRSDQLVPGGDWLTHLATKEARRS